MLFRSKRWQIISEAEFISSGPTLTRAKDALLLLPKLTKGQIAAKLTSEIDDAEKIMLADEEYDEDIIQALAEEIRTNTHADFDLVEYTNQIAKLANRPDQAQMIASFKAAVLAKMRAESNKAHLEKPLSLWWYIKEYTKKGWYFMGGN